MPRLTHRPYVLLLAVLVGPSAPAATAAQEVALTLRLQEGVTYRQVMTQENYVEMEIMGQNQDTHNRSTTTTSLLVREVFENGDMVVEVTYDAMSMTMNSAMMSVTYDSEDPPDIVPQPAMGLAAMVGQTFSLRFAPDGQIVESSGLAELADRLIEGMDLPGGPIGDSMRESFESLFGEEGFAKSMTNMTGHIPAEPVSVGDSWSRSVDIPTGIQLSMESTWSLTDVRDGVAHVSATATLGDGTQSVLEMGPMTMRYVLTGEQSTSMEIDPATGWTIRATTEGTFSGTMTMDMPGAGEMETPISMRSTMTIAPAGGS